jgi:hypothetical protein
METRDKRLPCAFDYRAQFALGRSTAPIDGLTFVDNCTKPNR